MGSEPPFGAASLRNSLMTSKAQSHFDRDRPTRVAMVVPSPFPANHGTPGSIRETAEAMAEIPGLFAGLIRTYLESRA